MTRSRLSVCAMAAAALVGGAIALGDARETYMKWGVHDPNRPQPPVVDPGYAGTQDKPGKAPSDAVVLFDGTNTDALQKPNGDPVGWVINDEGSLVRVRGKGNVQSKQAFGDIQLHLEWKIPQGEANGKGQRRGNSGIFLMNTYELQVLDNKDNQTYPDGMAGSIYGQFPPLANPGLGIEKWQTYDIIFRAPKFNEDGSLSKPAYVTAFINGVLVQDNQQIMGKASHKKRTDYKAHADKLPLTLQNHGEEVHYRNIWVRELPPRIE